MCVWALRQPAVSYLVSLIVVIQVMDDIVTHSAASEERMGRFEDNKEEDGDERRRIKGGNIRCILMHVKTYHK